MPGIDFKTVREQIRIGRELERQSHVLGFGDKTGRAYIVNEAHSMNKRVVRQFLTTLDRIPGHVAWIFTTTAAGQKLLFEESIDASPLLSRCQRIKLRETGLAQAFAERAREIAVAEGLDGRPISYYLERVKQNRNNLRAVLQEVQQGKMLSVEVAVS